MKLSLKNLERVVSVSKFVENALKLAFDLDNVITFHNFVELDAEIFPALSSSRFDVREYLELPSNSRIVLYSGRLTPEKGIVSLLNAFKIVVEKDKTLFLVIAGEGILRPYVENIAQRVGNVLVTGQVSRKIMLRLMAQSDVLAVPSICSEGCPTVVLEAMALGTPVVATAAGGIPELVAEEDRAYLVKPGDPYDLAQSISFALVRGPSKQRDIERIRKFDVEIVGHSIEQLYENVSLEKRR